MIYPHKGLEADEVDSDIFPVLYGSKGLARVMRYNPRTKRDFSYKDKTIKDFGKIFSPEEIGKYSGKIAYICDRIRQSKGIVFVYSQYIDGGAVPIALALESMGITRYGRASSLFKKPQATPLNVLTMEPKEDGKPFKPAKYMMITGQKLLTTKKEREKGLLAVTNDDNINFIDLETTESIITDSRLIRKKYNKAFKNFCDYYSTQCSKNKIDYVPVLTSDSLDKSLMQYLMKRGQIGK